MPKVVVIAGPNGAGKSTTAPAILRNVLHVGEFVNADTIATELSVSSPESVAVAAGRLMLSRVQELARARRDFAFETTLASRSFAPWLNELQESGYVFYLIYLSLPTVDVAIGRVRDRVQRGGHNVPEPVIRRRYERGLRNFFQLYSPFADSWLMLDNSAEPPAPIAKRAGKQARTVLDSSRWTLLSTTYDR